LEFLKEFFHFILTGKARKLIHEVTGSIPTDEDLIKAENVARGMARHAEFVRKVDEVIDSQPVPDSPPPPLFIEYKPKLDLPQHTPVYTLSPAQFERLQVSAKIGNIAWSIPQPLPSDDKEVADGLETLNQEIADLQGLGLVKDVSDLPGEDFQSRIAKAVKQFGRHVRYYSLTRYAVAMFQGEVTREGDNDVRKERTIQ
jgi:hypothetical protein